MRRCDYVNIFIYENVYLCVQVCLCVSYKDLDIWIYFIYTSRVECIFCYTPLPLGKYIHSQIRMWMPAHRCILASGTGILTLRIHKPHGVLHSRYKLEMYTSAYIVPVWGYSHLSVRCDPTTVCLPAFSLPHLWPGPCGLASIGSSSWIGWGMRVGCGTGNLV